jgi:uncharacterized protein (TIGR03437 family)
MLRASLALAAVSAVAAWGAAPSYSAASIVNAGNFTPGPFAPNSLLTIFGANLARSAQAIGEADVRDGYLPTELNYTQVFVDNIPAPLWYVSDGQINFLMPAKQATGPAKIRVAREGVSGPEVAVQVVDAAPALFATADGYAVATDAKGALLTTDSPAQGGDIIVLYATGLGKTSPNTATGALPRDAAQIVMLNDLKVIIGGITLEASRILYAGVSPGYAGLYQINLSLPDHVDALPEIRVTIGAQSSPSGLKLPAR